MINFINFLINTILVPVFIIILVGLILWLPIWLLWNWFMPNITVEPFFKEITFLQAIWIGILSRILFQANILIKND